MKNGLTDISGIRVGHWTDREAATGCTVVLCPEGAVAGVDVRGGAPGTRETDLLSPLCTIEEVHALLIGGGSAFGLAAADGVMRWLEERGVGYDAKVARVPIVPAAILFDLGVGRPDVRPDAEAGYAACEAATEREIEQGTVGAGTGATAGKSRGLHRAIKSGLGTASQRLTGHVIVAAMVAVNSFGDVYDPLMNRVIAAARGSGGGFLGATQMDREQVHPPSDQESKGLNTTLGVVATNARLTKAQTSKIAQMAHDGLARAIRPVHTQFDGDTIFALSHGIAEADINVIGTVAADLVAQAVVNGVRYATSLHGIPSAQDWQQSGRKD